MDRHAVIRTPPGWRVVAGSKPAIFTRIARGVNPPRASPMRTAKSHERGNHRAVAGRCRNGLVNRRLHVYAPRVAGAKRRVVRASCPGLLLDGTGPGHVARPSLPLPQPPSHNVHASSSVARQNGRGSPPAALKQARSCTRGREKAASSEPRAPASGYPQTVRFTGVAASRGTWRVSRHVAPAARVRQLTDHISNPLRRSRVINAVASASPTNC